jgi:hypothetical protein
VVPEKVALAECDDERLLLSVLEAQEVAVLSAVALSETLVEGDRESAPLALTLEEALSQGDAV